MPENKALGLNSIILPQRSIAYFDARTIVLSYDRGSAVRHSCPPQTRDRPGPWLFNTWTAGQPYSVGRQYLCQDLGSPCDGRRGISLAPQHGNGMNRLKFPVSQIDAVAKRP